MSILPAHEGAAAAADVETLIRSTEETVKVLKVTPAEESGFAGQPAPTPEVTVSVPALLADKQPSDLLQVDHDYMVSLLPDTEVEESYLLEIRGALHTIVDIKRVNLFGTVTHLEVAVKKRRGT